MRPTILKATPWILAILCIGLTASAFAARARFIEERSYIGALGLLTSISSQFKEGFDGVSIYQYDGETYTQYDLLPKIKTNYGFGGLVGYRRGDYAVEISYWRSEHKAEFTDVNIGTVVFQDLAIYHSLNADLKRFILTHLPVQPYISGGFCFPWLVVSNSSQIAGTAFRGNTSWSGVGFNAGAGLEVFATPYLSIVGGVVRRWSDFNHSRGIDRQLHGMYRMEADKIAGRRDGSFNFQAGITVDFM